MKYFLHDTNARNDEKVTLLYIEFGYEGVGLFYSIIELLALQEKPVSEKVLKSQLNIKKRLEKQLTFMYKIGILSIKNDHVFNENILNFSEKYQVKKQKNRDKISEWREKQADKKDVTSYEPKSNDPKVKESKVKESKVNNNVDCEILINYSFDEFWNAYDKKVGKKEKLKKKWKSFTDDKRHIIMLYIEDYKKAQPNKQYRKNPETFFNQESWKDELINNSNNNGSTKTFAQQDRNERDQAFKNIAKKYMQGD